MSFFHLSQRTPFLISSSCSLSTMLGRLQSTTTTTNSNLTSRLQGKVAIVTASTDGIGLGIARRLSLEGCSVMISSRKEANVARTVKELNNNVNNLGKVSGQVCHVGKGEDRERLVQETVRVFGGVDFLVSNAAVNTHFGNMLDCSEEQWEKVFDVNVKCSFLLTKLVVPHMLQRGGGSIVFVSSIAAYTPLGSLGAYSVSKTALLGLIKALSCELAPRNIRVNAIAPGIIKTKFSKELTENPQNSEKFLDSFQIKRFGTPEDISGVASFLCSEDAAYITGEAIVAAGGVNSRL